MTKVTGREREGEREKGERDGEEGDLEDRDEEGVTDMTGGVRPECVEEREIEDRR